MCLTAKSVAVAAGPSSGSTIAPQGHHGVDAIAPERAAADIAIGRQPAALGLAAGRGPAPELPMDGKVREAIGGIFVLPPRGDAEGQRKPVPDAVRDVAAGAGHFFAEARPAANDPPE